MSSKHHLFPHEQPTPLTTPNSLSTGTGSG